MKESLIRLTGEKNLFYDSEDRLYRYRMYCPRCGGDSGCRCFNTLEKAEDFIEDDMSFLCSRKCLFRSLVDDQGIDDIRDTMFEMGFKDRVRWYIFRFTGYISEIDACEVIDAMDIDFDSVQGESC